MSGQEVREVRYVRTSSLTRVLAVLEEKAVAALSADRTRQYETTGADLLPYTRVADKGVRALTVDFNALLHGPLDKETLIAGVTKSFDEAQIQELDLYMPEGFSTIVSERIQAPIPAKNEIAKLRFVMHLVHYPCRRDGEKNRFWADVRGFMTEGERAGMEPASLDLAYFVPFEVFRDATRKRGRIGAELKEAVNEWKGTIGSQPDLVRDGFRMVFTNPDFRNRRDYEWAPEKRWILRNVGET